jgi:hypothetical protein
VPTDVSADLLSLLENEHRLYVDLLRVARELGRLLAGRPATGRTLEALVIEREEIYNRLEVSEQVTERLVSELAKPSEGVRRAARAIRATIRQVLKQDRSNEMALRALRQRLETENSESELLAKV